MIDINQIREEQEREIFCAVGKCLRAWSGVEHSLTQLYCSLNDVSHSAFTTVQVTFEAIHSFEIRLSLTNEVIKYDQRNEGIFQKQWNGLHNKISKMSRKRNQVAHFDIVVHRDSENETIEVKLHPFFTLRGLVTSTGATPLTANDILSREKSFIDLGDRISRFSTFVEISRGRQQVGSRPITDLDHLLDNPFVPNPREI